MAGDVDHRQFTRIGSKTRRLLSFHRRCLVGIENVNYDLSGWFLNGKPRRSVISLAGMGGSGKTIVVATTYNSQVDMPHFDS
uniref:NB-ARC domain-containing protein n=1 Tax=Salix viminalis TaxID=40686 RepID=A0A6N2L6M3_SALVM